MANITIIAAVGRNRELGKNNDLIWHIKEDMKFFKECTMNKKIIMGSKTFYSLPGLLPNRKHIVLTRRNLDLSSEVLIIHNIEDLLTYLKELKEEVMVIGGAQIYKEMLPYTDTMILTEIEETTLADAYFPEFNETNWEKETLGNYETPKLKYKRVEYTRK